MAKLNHKVFGSGEPIIIMHGLFGMLDNWQTIGKNLSNDYMVYLIDLRDHGKSDHTDKFNYPLLAQDVAEFMESEWIHNAHIIGHSMGGKTAIQLANDYPDMVKKLIVVDIGIKAYKGGHETILNALQSVPIDEVKSRQEVEDILSNTISDGSIRLFLMKNLSRDKKSGGYRWKMNLPLLIKHYDDILAGISLSEVIDTHTLIIRGGQSAYILDEDIPEISSHFSDVDIKTVVDAGHWVHADHPDELLSLVRSFIG